MPSFCVNPRYAGMSQVVPGLYVSGVCGLTPANLEAANVGIIINATNEVPQVRNPAIERIKLWLDDTPVTPIEHHFDVICDRIDASLNAEVPVLLHCVAGVSRSATLCLAYLLKHRCRSLRDAYRLMAARRALVRPNEGFWRQLINYERIVKNRRARREMPSFRVNPRYAGMSEVVPGLYVSGVCGLTPANLEAANVGLIINATNEVPQVRNPAIERIKLWLDDTPVTPIEHHFDIICDRIDASLNAEVPVLVHCVAGVSRSATLCLAYLLKHRCRSLRDAYRLMAARRTLVRPNEGFWRQLINYERIVKGGLATVRLVQNDEQKKIISDYGCDTSLYIPDVYLAEEDSDYSSNEKSVGQEDIVNQAFRSRNNSSGPKRKFTPILDTLIETDCC